MKIIGIIFAAVLVILGITLLPAVKTFTDAVFSDMADMDALLTLLVSTWPIIVLLFFVFGAYVLARRGQ